MIPRIKCCLYAMVLVAIFSGLASCKPKTKFQVDTVTIKIPADKTPLALLIPTGCVGSSWLYRRGVTRSGLDALARLHTKGQPGSQINTELMVAVVQNNYSEVKRLLETGVDVAETNASGCTALIWSIVYSRRGITTLLLESGADLEQPDAKGMTPLMFAVLAKDEVIFQRLLERGADIHAVQTRGRNEIGTTVLHHAVSRKGNFPIVKELVDRGAVVTAANETGRTVLMKAAYWGDIAYLELLVSKGADLERVSNIGQTALHNFIGVSEKMEMFNYLMDQGVNVNTADKWGKTPLMTSASWGLTEYVRRLVNAGADVEAKSNEGKTALDFARERKQTEVITYLESLN